MTHVEQGPAYNVVLLSLLVYFQCKPIGVHWSREILVESIGVGDLVELVDPYRKKTLTKARFKGHT